MRKKVIQVEIGPNFLSGEIGHTVNLVFILFLFVSSINTQEYRTLQILSIKYNR